MSLVFTIPIFYSYHQSRSRFALREYSVTGVVECSVPTLTAYRNMSDSDFMEIDYDTGLLFHDGGPGVEEVPAPAPPTELVCGEDQLFSDSQLVRLVNEPSQVPAPQPPTSPAVQQSIDPPQPPLVTLDESEEASEWEEDKFQEVGDEEVKLLNSDAEEEQQDVGDQEELLPSEKEASFEEVSQEEVEEQVPLQSEPGVPDLAWEA